MGALKSICEGEKEVKKLSGRKTEKKSRVVDEHNET